MRSPAPRRACHCPVDLLNSPELHVCLFCVFVCLRVCLFACVYACLPACMLWRADFYMLWFEWILPPMAVATQITQLAGETVKLHLEPMHSQVLT